MDALIYEDQMYDQLRQQLKLNALEKIADHDYSRAADGNLGVDGPTKIALLVGQGDITRGSTNDSDQNGITSAGMIRQLRAVRDDASIKAVILRIDLPGGDGTASDDILTKRNCSARRSQW